MTEGSLIYRGETIRLGPLLSHYRKQAWRFPKDAPFWRVRVRAMIAEYRSQHSAPSESLAS